MTKEPTSAWLEGRKKQLFDEMASGLVIRDAANVIVWCNAAAEATLGLPLEAMKGRRTLEPVAESVRPDLSPFPADSLPSEVCLRTGQAVRDLVLGVHQPDGGLRWLNVDTFPLHGADGSLLGIGSIFDDVTAQMGISHNLVRSQERIAELLDSMTDAYFTLARDWTFVFVNRQGERLLERPRDELIGADLWSEFPGAEGHFRHHYERAMEGHHVEFEAYYDGLEAWLEVRSHPVPDGIAVYFRDVTDQRRAAAEREQLLASAERSKVELAHAAAYDPLTDLPNRLSLNLWLTERLARPDGPGAVAVLFIDLDRFKMVNDTHGHAEGDALLVQAARRLRDVVDPDDLVARLGGDEFVVAPGGTPPEAAHDLATRLLHEFRRPFEVENRRLVVTASIGIAFAGLGASPGTLLRDADAALYQAKDAGRNRICLFDDRVRQSVVTRLDIETDLREALDRFQIVAHFQPLFDARSGQPFGVEALARWQHPTRGLLQPDSFIPVAEDSGLIIPLGDEMLDLAIACADELDAGLGLTGGAIWVNVSARQLEEPFFARDLIARVERAGLVGRFGVEITETALSHDERTTEGTLRRLDDAGLFIAIDDFGTGYSSLARLVRYPVHLLKIDRSFVDGLTTAGTRPIVAAIIELAHAIGARSCAEGVETAAQLEILRELAVDLVSGFHLCRPVPAQELGKGIAQVPRWS